jgi:hypothetical protein
MSNAHFGSRLVLSGNVIPVGFADAHFDFNKDATGIQFGNLVIPSTTSIYTNRPVEGKFGGGIAVEQGTANMWTTAPVIYSNFGSGNQIISTITPLSETYMGQPVYRLQMTPVSANAVTDMQTNLASHGIMSNNPQFTFQSGNTYMASVYWRAYKSDIVVGGTASNISGWSDVGTYSSNSGWNRSVAKWLGIANGTDNKFWAFKSPSVVANETITIDWTCPQIEQSTALTSFTSGTRGNGLVRYPTSVINIPQGFMSFWMYARTDSNSFGSVPNPLFSAGIDGCFDLLISSTGTNYLRGYNSSGGNTQLNPHIKFDKWSHVVVYWNRNVELGIYIDGALDMKNTSPVDWQGYYFSNATGFYIGSGIRSNPNIVLSDLRIGTTFPSAEDVSAWYTSQVPFYNPFDKRAYAL